MPVACTSCVAITLDIEMKLPARNVWWHGIWRPRLGSPSRAMHCAIRRANGRPRHTATPASRSAGAIQSCAVAAAALPMIAASCPVDWP
jgi:hypothetical protein